MKLKDIIPVWLVEAAVADGWEVVGYSEFIGGIPEIRGF